MNADLKVLANVVEKFAPTIADMLLGSGGGLAVSALERLFGVNADMLPSTIAADPDAAEKLKSLEVQNYGLVVTDRESARTREVDLAKLGKKNWVMDWIALVTIAGFFIMCAMVASAKFDNSDHDILYSLIGQLSAGFLLVLGFYFGGTNK